MESIQQTKQCRACELWKSVDDFHKNVKMRDGRNGICKPCAIAKSAKWRQENRERYLETKRHWRATKGATEEYRNKSRERAKTYAQEHADELREYRRSLGNRLSHRRRQQIAENISRIPEIHDWRAMVEFFGRVCLCCGSASKISADHVIPISLGGVHHITNMQPLCLDCNRKKHATIRDYRDPAKFAIFLKSLQT